MVNRKSISEGVKDPQEMFDAAAAELTEEEREDRELLLGAFEAEEDKRALTGS